MSCGGSPREALARTLWLRRNRTTSAADWETGFAWHEAEAAKPDRGAADASEIGRCVRQAERALQWIEEAGLRVELPAPPDPT